MASRKHKPHKMEEIGKLCAHLEGTDVQIPNSTIPQLFDIQFEQEGFGEKTALIQDDKRISFIELRQRAEELATKLFHMFSRNGEMENNLPEVFGLFTSPSDSRIFSILGLLKLKCAYLPLDFTLPAERMAAMLHESGVKYVICDETTETALQTVIDISSEVKAINIKDLFKSDIKEINGVSWSGDEVKGKENPLVCILYTSGSTGVQKGVPLYTKNVLNRLTWQWKEVPFDKEDVGCHKTSMLFVDSMNEILSCLLMAVQIVILPKSETSQPDTFVKAIQRFQISRLVLVPSHLNMLIDYLQVTKGLDRICSLRTVISSGEELPVKTSKQFFDVFQKSVLYNFYGSTETTGDITYDRWECSEDVGSCSLDGVMSLGKPVYNSTVMILDDNGTPCNEGEVGHIWVSGLNVASNYIGNSKATTNTFIPNVFFQKKGHTVLYKMGDLGVVRNGKLYHLGRCDAQVKVRGHRVNLYEIQQIMKAIDGIDECLVLPYKDINGYIVPIAFYTSKENENDMKGQVLNQCEKKLPKYAVPRHLLVSTFPKQIQTGKVDRQRLLQSYKNKIVGDQTSINDAARRTTKNQQILKVLARNISVPADDINLSLSFLENGGNSFSAVAAVHDLQSEGYDMTLEQFMSFGNINNILECNESMRTDVSCSIDAQYEVVSLNSIHNKEQAIDVLSRGYAQKGPLHVLLGVTDDSFSRSVHSIWPLILEEDLSVVVIDKSTKDVVGVYLALDLGTEYNAYWPKPELTAIFSSIKDPVREKLLRLPGKWAHARQVAVDSSVAEDMVFPILKRMQTHLTTVIKGRGYSGIFTLNANPVTTAMDEESGYIPMGTIQANTFCYEGQRPFRDVEDNVVVMALIKHLT